MPEDPAFRARPYDEMIGRTREKSAVISPRRERVEA